MIYTDDPYTIEQLKEPRLNELIVKPLVRRLYDPDDVSVGEKTQLHQPEAEASNKSESLFALH